MNVNVTALGTPLLFNIMGRLVIAHHKSYHPYRRDNIEKVRKDEEEARLKEEREEGRMMLAVRNNLGSCPYTQTHSLVRVGLRGTH